MSADGALLRRKQYLALASRRARPDSGSSRALLVSRNWQDPGMDIGVDLQRVRTPFVVGGAVATWLYMPQRMTRALDLLVLATDAPRLHAELAEAGCARTGTLSIGSELDVLESSEPWAVEAVLDPDR